MIDLVFILLGPFLPNYNVHRFITKMYKSPQPRKIFHTHYHGHVPVILSTQSLINIGTSKSIQ